MLMRRGTGAALVAAATLALLLTSAVTWAGTPVTVRLATPLSSETAHAGDAWTGTLVGSVAVGGEKIPAGSTVRGVVTGAHPAGIGTRAMLDLAIRDVSSGGKPRTLDAGMDAMQAAVPVARGASRYAVEPAPKGAPVRLDAGAQLVFTVVERQASR